MSSDVLVVIDFYDANQTQRNSFAAQIGASDWQHHPALANSYYASFDDDAPDEVLVTRSEDQLRQAVHKAGIEQWDATCIVGDTGWLREVAGCPSQSRSA